MEPTKRSEVPRDQRPAIKIRRFESQLGQDTPIDWADNNPVSTQFLNAISTFFPGVEHYALESVNKALGQISNPILRREARIFAGQESVHSQEHDDFNHWQDQHGLKLTRLTAINEKAFSKISRYSSIRVNLARIVAVEHLFAVVGHALLTNQEILSRMHPDVRPMWIWHAIEEIEHKAVAFDVYQAVSGSYWLRVLIFFEVLVTIPLWIMTLHLVLLFKTRQLLNWRSHIGFLYRLIGSGFLSQVEWGQLDYLRRDFHPWQTDDRQVLADAFVQIEANLEVSKIATANSSLVAIEAVPA